MLRDNLIVNLKELNSKMEKYTGEDLLKAKSEFDSVRSEIDRIDYIARCTPEVVQEAKKEMADKELWGEFGKMLRGEEVGDVARDALSPRTQFMKDAAGKGSFRAPGLGMDYFRSTLTSASGSHNLFIAPLEGLYQLPFPPTYLFDKATKINAINGVAYPLLNQSNEDPFAGVTITSGTSEGSDKTESGAPSIGKTPITTAEKNAYVVVADLALRRAPSYEGIIANLLTQAIKFDINSDIADELVSAGTSTTRATSGGLWASLVALKYANKYYYTQTADFYMSQSMAEQIEVSEDQYGRPLFNSNPSLGLYNQLAGRSYYLENLPTYGSKGDIIFVDPRNYYVAVEQDVVFRRTDQGLTLGKANSTAFFVFAHIGGALLNSVTCAVLAA
jgi:HK97 family phage major capsid protein